MSESTQQGLVLEATGLSKTYQDGELKVEVLHGINLSISRGDTIAIVGASGSGKSTLLHLLGGLDVPTTGAVRLSGQDLTRLNGRDRGLLRNRAVGMVYQFHHLLPEFTALENVSIPAVIGGKTVDDATEMAGQLLTRVGLAERMMHKPGELSGGERQRTAIARALINTPQLVLADEPTGNLDAATADEIWKLMRELNEEYGTAFVVVTHAKNLARQMKRVYEITNGQLNKFTLVEALYPPFSFLNH